MAGTLFVVATPIGNLEDITLRALRTLREVDLIAAEDTRRTAKLLAHYEIRKPMVSLHEHNEHREGPRLVERMAHGISVALVSDAGTPGISDPGAHLVSLAHERGLTVTPVPGPSAVMAALSVSGKSASEFVFVGFPPHGGLAREAWIGRVAKEVRPVVAFESPHRIKRALAELNSLVNKQIIVLREATKLNEQLAISPISADIPERGEFVIVISSKLAGNEESGDDSVKEALAIKLIGCMTANDEFALDLAFEMAARSTTLSLSRVKKAWKKHRILEKRRADDLS